MVGGRLSRVWWGGGASTSRLGVVPPLCVATRRCATVRAPVHVSTLTAPAGKLLAAVRATLASADEALLCVAFAQPRGVHLVADELAGVAKRGPLRAVVTTTLGSTSPAALAAMRDSGASIRVLNPGGGTYHPKVFLGRRGDALTAVVGSANLTSGLVANVEVAIRLEGLASEPVLAELWQWAEATWANDRCSPWLPAANDVAEETIEPELLSLIVSQVKLEPTVYTLGAARRPNFVADATASGLYVETERSRAEKRGAQLVSPAMLNLAWDALRARGELSNADLLNELRVHRSSFVCALLARLPGVTLASKAPIVLRYSG